MSRIEGDKNDDRQSSIERLQQQREQEVELERAAAEQQASELAARLAAEAQPKDAGGVSGDGAAKVDAAVSEAHVQADRGEAWRDYQGADRGDLPQSVEDLAKAGRAQVDEDEKKKEAERRVTAAELQFQLAQQGRGLRG